MGPFASRSGTGTVMSGTPASQEDPYRLLDPEDLFHRERPGPELRVAGRHGVELGVIRAEYVFRLDRDVFPLPLAEEFVLVFLVGLPFHSQLPWRCIHGKPLPNENRHPEKVP